MNSDLRRIANALEHLAFAQIGHPAKSCAICTAKQKKPLRRMPPSVVLSADRLAKMEAYIKQRRLMAGPEQPVADMFRYRELNEPPKNS
jgi:hypothetical protein